MLKIRMILLMIFIGLMGCDATADSKPMDNDTSSITSGSLHNYETEIISAALDNHPDFPDLSPNESVTEEIGNGDNRLNVTYSSKIEINPHDATVTYDSESGITTWKSPSKADYFITLLKEWERDGEIGKSYWKYEYNPQTDDVKLLDSEVNNHSYTSEKVHEKNDNMMEYVDYANVFIQEIRENSIVIAPPAIDSDASYPTYEIYIDGETKMEGKKETFNELDQEDGVHVWISIRGEGKEYAERVVVFD